MSKNNIVISDNVTAEESEAVTEVVKKKRPGRSALMQPQTEEGDNRKYLTHALKFFNVEKVDILNPAEVYQRSIDYLETCATDDMKPSVTGYSLALGYSRSELFKIARGDMFAGKPEIEESRNTIKKVKALIEQQYESYMQNGKINPVAGIFMLKNNFSDYSDKQEIEVKASPLDNGQSREEIAERYIEALPDIDT